MDTTKSKVMLNADPEIAAPDLKKNQSPLHGFPIKMALLVVAALLIGMVIATVIIFTTENHVKFREEESSLRHKFEGHRKHHTLKGTVAPDVEDEEDGDDKLTKNLGSPDYSSSSWLFWPSSWSSSSSYSSSSIPWDWDYPSSGQSDWETPSNPETPEEPSDPETPEEPSDPETPSNPDAPSNPDSTISEKWDQLQQNDCGASSVQSRIVNGREVTDSTRWPWAGYLSSSRPTAANPASGYFCGAELISYHWAVTAAHCISDIADPNNPDLTIVFGHLDQTSPKPNTASVISVSKVIKHENYDDQTTNNDIALLKLSSKVTFSDNLRPVCVNDDSDEYTRYSKSEADCYVVGWGATSSGGPSSGNLQEVESPLVENAQQCKDLYASQAQVTDQMICAQTDHKGDGQTSGSCQGDSGGPMQCRAGGKFYLVGVTSWGIGCADERYPDVMARVSQFYSWIKGKIISDEL